MNVGAILDNVAGELDAQVLAYMPAQKNSNQNQEQRWMISKISRKKLE